MINEHHPYCNYYFRLRKGCEFCDRIDHLQKIQNRKEKLLKLKNK